MATRNKYIPLIVSLPLFLQSIDLTAMATALPRMAQSLDVPVLRLNMVISAYVIALAAFLPLSAWLADRYGAKRIFCAAIVIFSLASALCGWAPSAGYLVLFRVLQGAGGAMMIPVGRLILLRSVPAAELVAAMVWFTIPSAIGRLAGPLVGGIIASLTSWRWIFLVNIPFGIVALILTVLLVNEQKIEGGAPRFDMVGFLLIASGLGSFLGGLETMGKGMAPNTLSLVLVGGGIAILCFYGLYSLRRAEPVIDLRILVYRTYRANVVGAAPLRFAIIGVPFILPLMFQLAFGLSPFLSGLLASTSALGSLASRFFLGKVLDRYSFKQAMMGGTLLTAGLFCVYGLFQPQTPLILIAAVMFGGGAVSAFCLVALNSFGFEDVPKERASHATALLAMAQQVISALSVVLAASLLAAFSWMHGGDGVHLATADFHAAILTAGLVAILSLFPFSRLGQNDAGKPEPRS